MIFECVALVQLRVFSHVVGSSICFVWMVFGVVPFQILSAFMIDGGFRAKLGVICQERTLYVLSYLIRMYCVGTLQKLCQFPRMYFLVCELCVLHRVVYVCLLACGVAGCCVSW